jgi:hypothetical protein
MPSRNSVRFEASYWRNTAFSVHQITG